MEQHASERHAIFPNLNGLRFIGALMILFFHCFTLNREIWGDFYNEAWFQKIGIVLSRGHLGVVLFFLISGFLITYLLLSEQSKGRFNLYKYLIRRFLRVWPLYFVVILFGFFIFPHLPYGIATVHEFWRFALFLSNFDEIIHGLNDPLNFLTATWTVSVEEQFYIAWGILIGLIAVRKKMTYVLLFCAIIAGSLIFRFAYVDSHRLLYYHTFSVMSCFALGGLAGLWAFTGGAQRFFEQLPRGVIIAVYLAGIAMILYEDHLFKGVFFALEYVVTGVFFVFVILEQIYARRSFYKADRIPGFFHGGQFTYGLYLFHSISIYYWAIFFRNSGYTEHIGHYLLFIAVVFVTTYIASWASYRYFEQQFLKLKRFFR